MLRMVACLIVCLLLQVTPKAESTRDILTLYGEKVSYEEEIKQAEYLTAVEKYEILEREVNYLNQFNMNVEDIDIASVYEKRAAIVDEINTLSIELCSNTQLSIDSILSMESRLSILQDQLQKIDNTIMYFGSLYTYEIPVDRVETALNEIDEKASELAEAVHYGEIGDVTNVKIPLSGNYYVSSHFGVRIDPLDGTSIDNHRGVDLAANTGTPVLALFSGVVTVAEEHYGMGKYVRINHGDGIVTTYLHLNSIDVKVGDKVTQYTKIGEVGSTGLWSTGPHLHLALTINGVYVDPYKLWR